MNKPLIIGSRGSTLALTQTRQVAAELQRLAPELEVRIEIIRTTGDELKDISLIKAGGKGLFTKELETALLDGSIDLAVHSCKDLPTELPEGLCIGAIPLRATPFDAFVSQKFDSIMNLTDGAVVGTSSLRRSSQLRAFRSDLNIIEFRGNVDTRLQKVANGEVDAAILACAGLERIGHGTDIRQTISPQVMVPAVAQGALALEIREDDAEVREVVSRIRDEATARAVEAERTLLRALGGGCRTPIGALGTLKDGVLRLIACVCTPDGATVLKSEATGLPAAAASIGEEAADLLMAQGARAILSALE